MSTDTNTKPFDENNKESSLNISTVESGNVLFSQLFNILGQELKKLSPQQKTQDVKNPEHANIILDFYKLVKEELDKILPPSHVCNNMKYLQEIEDGESKILSLLHHNLFVSCGDDLVKKEMVSHINPTFIVMYIKNRPNDPVYQNWRKSETKVDESLILNYFTSLVEGILRDPPKEQECVHNKSYIEYEPQQNPIFSVKEDDKKYCIRNKFTDPPLLEYTDIYAYTPATENYVLQTDIINDGFKSMYKSIEQNDFEGLFKTIKCSIDEDGCGHNIERSCFFQYVKHYSDLIIKIFSHCEQETKKGEEIASYSKDYIKEICQHIFNHYGTAITHLKGGDKDNLMSVLSSVLTDCFEIVIRMPKQNMFLLKILLKSNLLVTEETIKKAKDCNQSKSIIKLLEKHISFENADEVQKSEDFIEPENEGEDAEPESLKEDSNTSKALEVSGKKSVHISMKWGSGSLTANITNKHITISEKDGQTIIEVVEN